MSQWGAGKNEFMAKTFLEKLRENYGGMGKIVKHDLQSIKMNFGAKNFEKFPSHFCVPEPDLALKHPGILKLEVLRRLRRNNFVFCLNFR